MCADRLCVAREVQRGARQQVRVRACQGHSRPGLRPEKMYKKVEHSELGRACPLRGERSPSSECNKHRRNEVQ